MDTKDKADRFLKNIPFIVFLEYEIRSNLWTPWISWGWLQHIIAWYFAKKTRRKYKRYVKSILLEEKIRSKVAFYDENKY